MSKVDEYRGIISKYFNNQYGFDTNQSEQMPVPSERIFKFKQLYRHASACWLNVSSAYKCCRLRYNILIVYIILKQFLILDKSFDDLAKCYS